LGGYGSGRHSGNSTADDAFKLDLAWMVRTALAREGAQTEGVLRWRSGGFRTYCAQYKAIMDEPGDERLELHHVVGYPDGKRQGLRQTIELCYTRPNYGGKRWWLICPYSHRRVAKLYLPPGGDRFASREAWRLGYRSQRVSRRDKPFEALFRLQERLGSRVGLEEPLLRPKGMWGRKFAEHENRYWELHAKCGVAEFELVAWGGLLVGAQDG